MIAKEHARLASLLVTNARATWGAGWSHLSPEQKRGAVCYALLRLMRNWDDEIASRVTSTDLEQIATQAFERARVGSSDD